MSLKLAMQRAARRAPRQLGESAELVRAFLRSRQNPDGGFQDRAGQSDLYYTVFGLQSSLALGGASGAMPALFAGMFGKTWRTSGRT